MSEQTSKNLIDTDGNYELKYLPVEIERKFLINRIPSNLHLYRKTDIAQGYLAVDDDGTEIRLRKKGNEYFQTIKNGKGKIRNEFEVEISAEQFYGLWDVTSGKRLTKTRYEIPYNGAVIELDVYHGPLEGLMTAEIEFSNELMSNNFVIPEWFGKEVTLDDNYKNQSLALSGSPSNRRQKVEHINGKEIPKYELEEGIVKVVDAIQQKLTETDGNIVVEVAGGSASGKTSAVSKKIQEFFGEKAMIISTDDYYFGKTYMDRLAASGEFNWDQPEAVNLSLFRQHLAQLKSGQTIDKPEYDMKTSEAVNKRVVEPKRIIIGEGLFALTDNVAEQGDVKVFVEIGTHGRVLRRLLRDISRTAQRPADILKYFSQVVVPMHDKYVESTKQNADIIILNEYIPAIEAEASGLHEAQTKFRGYLSDEDLLSKGAVKLKTGLQVDRYYNPTDRNLMDSGELLRIREEGDSRTLTYKGPRLKGDVRKRPNFEFDIDKETEDSFLRIYGNMIKTIIKERAIFELSGIKLSVDKVWKQEKGLDTELGTFIEIKLPDKEQGIDSIRELLARLGLNPNLAINQSYFEM